MRKMGSTLKSYRLERYCTLDDISKKTNISTNILQAIEKEEFHRIPGSFHLKHFLKGYLNALEIESKAFFKTFENQIQAVSEDYSFSTPLNISKIRYYRFKKRNILIKLITMIIMLSGLGFLLIANHGRIPPVGHLFKKPLTVPEQIFYPKIVMENFEYDFHPVQLTLTCRDQCWIQIIKGDTLVVEKILEKEERFTIEGYQISVTVDNPSRISLAVNGKTINKFASNSIPKTFTLNPSNIKGQLK